MKATLKERKVEMIDKLEMDFEDNYPQEEKFI